jgi:dimethylglycine dehydrogenase
VVGVTTGGAYGHATQMSLAFAYVEPTLTAPGTRLDVLLLGDRRAATVLSDAVWDPANTRPRA